MNTANLQKEWIYKEYVNRENLIVHAPFEPEMDFYSAVQNGDLRKVKTFLHQDFSKTEGLGKLSDNQLQNIRYHLVITTAVIARKCIEAGLPLEQAYSLSDFYIQKADKEKSLNGLDILHDEIVVAYANLMKKLRAENVYSKPIINCLNYIYSHLHTRITLENLADKVSLSPSYLSRLFKQETGMTVSDYIAHQKIETAKNMLQFSDYSPGEISTILGFSSQSYFTECFKAATGTTPKQFARTH